MRDDRLKIHSSSRLKSILQWSNFQLSGINPKPNQSLGANETTWPVLNQS